MFSVLFPFILKFAVCTLQTELTGTSDRNRKRLPAYQLTLIQQQQHLSNKHSFIARFKKLEKARNTGKGLLMITDDRDNDKNEEEDDSDEDFRVDSDDSD